MEGKETRLNAQLTMVLRRGRAEGVGAVLARKRKVVIVQKECSLRDGEREKSSILGTVAKKRGGEKFYQLDCKRRSFGRVVRRKVSRGSAL